VESLVKELEDMIKSLDERWIINRDVNRKKTEAK
jgi:hypothetical protein